MNNHVYLDPWSEIIGRVNDICDSENGIILTLSFKTVSIINILKKDLTKNTKLPEKNDRIAILRTDTQYTIRVLEENQKPHEFSLSASATPEGLYK